MRIQFLNNQAQSSQLWYLLEAKSVCTNQVVGSWRLLQQKTTDTIYCFNRDDVSLFIFYFIYLFNIQMLK